MAATRSPGLLRTVPTKQPIPPISVRPAVSAANSAPTLKSACWTLMRATRSASCHRRKECHLVAGTDTGGRVGEFLVHRASDRSAVGEGAGIAGASLRQPGDEVGDRGNAGGHRQLLLGGADAFTQPGEIQNCQWGFDIGHGNSTWCGYRLDPAI